MGSSSVSKMQVTVAIVSALTASTRLAAADDAPEPSQRTPAVGLGIGGSFERARRPQRRENAHTRELPGGCYADGRRGCAREVCAEQGPTLPGHGCDRRPHPLAVAPGEFALASGERARRGTSTVDSRVDRPRSPCTPCAAASGD